MHDSICPFCGFSRQQPKCRELVKSDQTEAVRPVPREGWLQHRLTSVLPKYWETGVGRLKLGKKTTHNMNEGPWREKIIEGNGRIMEKHLVW